MLISYHAIFLLLFYHLSNPISYRQELSVYMDNGDEPQETTEIEMKFDHYQIKISIEENVLWYSIVTKGETTTIVKFC